MSELVVVLAAFAALVVARQRRHRRLPARAVIVSPRKSTTISADGAVRSVQSAEITMAKAELDRLWTPTNLENLARTYWRFLSRVTLGLIRVVYGSNERSVVFLTRPITLLRFSAPEYVLEPDHGNVRWQIRGGLLVARRGRRRGCGYLSLDVRRALEVDAQGQAKLRIEVEVANFYPSIAAGFSTPAYEMTQSALHVLVTHAFLRSLAKLNLATSKIGRLSKIMPAMFRRPNGGSPDRGGPNGGGPSGGAPTGASETAEREPAPSNQP